MFLKQPYSICDALWTDHDMTTWNGASALSVDTTDGVTVTNSASSNKYLWAYSSNSNVYSQPFVVEYTLIEYTGTVIMRVDNGTSKDKYLSSLGLSANDKVRIEVTDTTIKFYKNGTEISGQGHTFSSGTCKFGFIINNGSVHWKDFRLYPI